MTYRFPPFPLSEIPPQPKVEIKLERERRDLIPKAVPSDGRSREKGEPISLAAYLAANPGMTKREFEGKGFHKYNPFDCDYVRPGEKPWHALNRAEVRARAIGTKARYMPKGFRQAAARDPGLYFDPTTLAYCLRLDGPPSPSTVVGTSTPHPPLKGNRSGSSRPAAA